MPAHSNQQRFQVVPAPKGGFQVYDALERKRLAFVFAFYAQAQRDAARRNRGNKAPLDIWRRSRR